MMRLLISLVLIVFAGPSSAEAIRVRSGEHADFTRLVFDLPLGVEWRLEQEDSLLWLVFSDGNLTFDISRVFELIPRTRLQSATTAPGTVTFDLGCACKLETQHLPPNKLVVDIVDSPAPDDQDVTVTLLSDQGATPTNLHDVFPLAPDLGPRPPGLPLPSTDTLQNTDALRKLLVNELGRAAVQGLVKPPSLPEPPVQLALPPAVPEIEQAPLSDTSQSIGVALETSVDRAEAGMQAPPLTAIGQACLSDTLFDFGAWFEDQDPTAGLAMARRNLMGEFDRVEPQHVAQLVQAQLALGMGAEAALTIETYGQELQDSPIYMALAMTIDDRSGAREDPFEGQESCNGRVALWAVLSAPERLRSQQIATGALAAAFSELPRHMRNQFIAPLSDFFLAREEIEVAKQLQNALGRTTKQPTESMRLSFAQTDIATGRPEHGEQELRALTYASGQLGPESHLNLLDRYLARGKPLPVADLLAAEAYALELRETDAGHRAARIAVIGYARSGQFTDAVRLLRGNAVDNATLDEVAVSAARSAPAPEFLINVQVMLSSPHEGHLSERARLAISERFAKEGFFQQAEAVLVPMRGTENSNVARARVELALAAGFPEEALRILTQYQLKGAELLQAKAYEMMPDYASATEAYSRADDHMAAQRMAWMARNWVALSKAGDTPHARFAAYAIAPKTLVSAPLQSAQATLAQGGQSRGLIEALISEFD